MLVVFLLCIKQYRIYPVLRKYIAQSKSFLRFSQGVKLANACSFCCIAKAIKYDNRVLYDEIINTPVNPDLTARERTAAVIALILCFKHWNIKFDTTIILNDDFYFYLTPINEENAAKIQLQRACIDRNLEMLPDLVEKELMYYAVYYAANAPWFELLDLLFEKYDPSANFMTKIFIVNNDPIGLFKCITKGYITNIQLVVHIFISSGRCDFLEPILSLMREEFFNASTVWQLAASNYENIVVLEAFIESGNKEMLLEGLVASDCDDMIEAMCSVGISITEIAKEACHVYAVEILENEAMAKVDWGKLLCDFVREGNVFQNSTNIFGIIRKWHEPDYDQLIEIANTGGFLETAKYIKTNRY